MKKLSLLALVFVAAGLSACDHNVKIVDGQIPQEFTAQVAPFLGTYPGQMDRQSNAISFSMEGNRLVATAAQDLVGPGCQSQIGNLTNISYTEDRDHNIYVTGAEFDFNPGRCGYNIQGRTLHVDFNSTRSFTVELLDHVDYQRVCNIYAGPYGPYESCRMEQYPYYLQGAFNK